MFNPRATIQIFTIHSVQHVVIAGGDTPNQQKPGAYMTERFGNSRNSRAANSYIIF